MIGKARRARCSRHLQSAYELTLEKYESLHRKAKGRCQICGTDEADLLRPLCVDHCHKTGRIRGLLCDKCNLALGMFGDSRQSLRRALKYLKEN